MKKKHLYIGLAIAIVACYYTFRNVSLRELGEALASVKYIYLIPALFLFTVYYYVRALRWRYLLLSVKEIHQNRLISPTMIGFMANMLPARLGELVRAYLLVKRENITFSSSFATIVVERVFDLISILAMFGMLLFFQPNLMNSQSLLGNPEIIGKMIMFGWGSLILIFLLIVFSLLLIYKQQLMISWLKFFCRPFSENVSKKVIDSLVSFTQALHVLKNFKTTVMIIFLSAVIWSFSLLTYYPFFYAFNIEYLPFSSVIILFIIVCIFITIFPTPGFVGSYQAGCVVALHSLFDVPEATAASFGIVTWAFMMGFTVLGGIYFIFRDNISIKELTEAHT